MRERADLAVRFVAAVAAGLLLAPVAGWLLDDVAFHRVLTRSMMLMLVVFLLAGRGHPRTWPASLRSMGLRGPRPWSRALVGAAAGITLVLVLLSLSLALGGREMGGAHELPLGVHLVVAVVSAVSVGVVEETLWRGYVQRALGLYGAAFFYAAVHYLRPLEKTAPAGPRFDPLLGVKRFPELLQSLLEPRHLTLGILSLFLVGVILGMLRRRTGTLLAGIGFHAGLVLPIELYRRFITVLPTGSAWVFGGTRLHDGLLAVALLALLWLFLRRRREPTGEPAAA